LGKDIGVSAFFFGIIGIGIKLFLPFAWCVAMLLNELHSFSTFGSHELIDKILSVGGAFDFMLGGAQQGGKLVFADGWGITVDKLTDGTDMP